MPLVELTAGGQTATIRYGWGIIHELSAALTKSIPPEIIKAKMGKEVAETDIVSSLSAEDIVGLLFGQMESQRPMVEKVLVQVKDADGKVLWAKSMDKPVAEFIDYDLEPDLGNAIAQHMALAVRERNTEVAGPKEQP